MYGVLISFIAKNIASSLGLDCGNNFINTDNSKIKLKFLLHVAFILRTAQAVDAIGVMIPHLLWSFPFVIIGLYTLSPLYPIHFNSVRTYHLARVQKEGDP
jgi:hypothetical protein